VKWSYKRLETEESRNRFSRKTFNSPFVHFLKSEKKWKRLGTWCMTNSSTSRIQGFSDPVARERRSGEKRYNFLILSNTNTSSSLVYTTSTCKINYATPSQIGILSGTRLSTYILINAKQAVQSRILGGTRIVSDERNRILSGTSLRIPSVPQTLSKQWVTLGLLVWVSHEEQQLLSFGGRPN